MGNQENIPGECVSGFIPATNKPLVEIQTGSRFLHNGTSSFMNMTY